MDNEEQRDNAFYLGRLLASLREYSGKTVVKTAGFLGISPEEWINLEKGDIAPNLPQLEALSQFFVLPVEEFLVPKNQVEVATPLSPDKIGAFIALRTRVIATLLKQARLARGIALEDFATQSEIGTSKLDEYESGTTPIPFPVLEMLVVRLGMELKSLLSDLTPKLAPPKIDLAGAQNSASQFPGDLEAFIANPSNLPYLELAKKLSEMDADKLRTIAEGLLEITY